MLESPTGGNQIFLASAELRFQTPFLAGRLGGAVFADIGQVIERRERELLGLRDVRLTPGIGVRFATPLGPMRLDVAYNAYGPQPGRLYLPEGQQLTEVSSSYPPAAPPTTFWGRLQWHFAVGPPF